MNIEWHAAKAKANLAKHGVSFEEAATVFSSSLSVTFPDFVPSASELRLLTFGISAQLRFLMVCHVEHGETQRIISARLMTKHERKQYEEGSFRIR